MYTYIYTAACVGIAALLSVVLVVIVSQSVSRPIQQLGQLTHLVCQHQVNYLVGTINAW